MESNAKIFVAGHRGLVGSALVRALLQKGFDNLVLRTSSELDLRDQSAVARFFTEARPEYVFLAAAKVGGIVANDSYPAEFIHDNLMIQTNILHHAYLNRVNRLLFLGSSCIYPKLAPQPLKEEYLLTGPLEPTNEPYAIAKIAGIGMCRSYNRQYGTKFLAAMPTNLYGPYDNFDLETSHVLPALIRKFHEAKVGNEERAFNLEPRTPNFEPRTSNLDPRTLDFDPRTTNLEPRTSADDKVVIWGTGTPKREFLHVADLADASLFLMNLPEKTFNELLVPSHESFMPGVWVRVPGLINIGTGEEVTIRELALLVKETVGFAGDLVFDASRPDGTPRKLLDVSLLHALGWRHRIGLAEGLRQTYDWYLDCLVERGSGNEVRG